MNDLGSSAYRLSDKPDEFVERINLRSGSVKDQMILFLAGVYRELRQVFNEYRLKLVLPVQVRRTKGSGASARLCY